MESLFGARRGSRLLLLAISLTTTAMWAITRPTSFRQGSTYCSWRSCKRHPSTVASLSQLILTRVHTRRVTQIIILTSKAVRPPLPPMARLASASIQSPKCARCVCLATLSSTELASQTQIARTGNTITMEHVTRSAPAVAITTGLREIASPAPTPILR